MIVASEHQAKAKAKEIQEIDRRASKEHGEAKRIATSPRRQRASALESL